MLLAESTPDPPASRAACAVSCLRDRWDRVDLRGINFEDLRLTWEFKESPLPLIDSLEHVGSQGRSTPASQCIPEFLALNEGLLENPLGANACVSPVDLCPSGKPIRSAIHASIGNELRRTECTLSGVIDPVLGRLEQLPRQVRVLVDSVQPCAKGGSKLVDGQSTPSARHQSPRAHTEVESTS